VRSTRREGQRVQLEVANFGSTEVEARLTLSAGGSGRETPLALGAGEIRRLSIAVPDGDAPIGAELSGDALGFDNAVTLLPARPRAVRVSMDVSSEALREPVEAALSATDRVRIFADDSTNVDIVITDRQAGTPRPGTWTLELRQGSSPVALGGPFLVNASHPLVEGLSLGGIVWGSTRGTMRGTPVISAGNTSLVTDEDVGDGGHLLRLSFAPELSTLHRTPAWPALVWNLIDWRSGSVPGFQDPNIRVGSLARFTGPRDVEEVTVVLPDGRRRSQALAAGSLLIRASAPGLWSVEAGNETFRFSANPIGPDESNLTSAASGTRGSWTTEPEPGETTRDLAWLTILLGLAVLLGHQRLVSRETA
jgi:hypothetical protein